MKEWDLFLKLQQDRLGADAINRWVKTLKIIDFDAVNLYLEASDPFQIHWFEQYLRPLAKSFFKTANGKTIQIHLALIGAGASSLKKEWKPPLDLSADFLLSTSTFHSFFPGETNHLSFILFQESIKSNEFNPLYLQGPKESGKSHLLMAACWEFKQRNQSCFYIKADRFTQHLVAAIRSGMMPLFREHYRKHDVLIIDEIETLADRSASQEELFHTFNALHLKGKQLIIAGRQFPSHLKGIEPRLTSRFEWGLTLSLSPLSPLELHHYFHHQLKIKQLSLSEEAIHFCLASLHSAPLLNRAIDLIKLHTKKMAATPALLEQWLLPLFKDQQQKVLNPQLILKEVARFFDLNTSDLEGKSQSQDHTFARQVAMYLCRHLLHLPYTQIAKIFSRDHSTVMASVKLIDKKSEEQPSVKAALDELSAALTADNSHLAKGSSCP
ncbi:MAG: DnaA/Hda family protein [Candidatus Rhabdochlamydia sp.]